MVQNGGSIFDFFANCILSACNQHLTIPSFIYISFRIQHVSLDNGHKYYATYLELGMRYEAGICSIAISMKGTFN